MHFMRVSVCLHISKNYVLQFFLITTNKIKRKNFCTLLVGIAKETAWEKIQRKETLLELELLEVFVSLNKRPYFCKSLSSRASIINIYKHPSISIKFVLISTIYFKVYTYLYLWFQIVSWSFDFVSKETRFIALEILTHLSY